MIYKQKNHTTKSWNPNTRQWDYYEIPTPEYVPDYTAMLANTKNLSLIVMVIFVICKGMGVM